MAQLPLRELRVRLEAEARRGVPIFTLEKDYAISYFLAGMSDVPELAPLHFKGGTLLRKVIFGDYRFSEDLDFSSTEPFECAQLLEHLNAAAISATRHASAYSALTFSVQRLNPAPHPRAQCAYKVLARYPWHRSDSAVTRLKLEVAMHEHLFFSGKKAPLIHDYAGESLAAEVVCYDLTEVVTEKLRAFVQVRDHLLAKGWVNPRARDLYDLWALVTVRGQRFDWPEVRRALEAKAKDVDAKFSGPDDFRDARVLTTYERVWGSKLAPLLVGGAVPDFAEARAVLDEVLAKVFP